ncbi:hypothetical protein ACLB2K_040691 [Fragaria x ananassa]
MATKIMHSSNHVHTQMMKIKFPKFARFPSSSSRSSLCDRALDSSPCSVLPENSKSNKKRPLSPQPLRVEQQVGNKIKKMKVVESWSSTPLPPTELRGAMLRIKHADIIFKAQKEHLEKLISDPVKLQKALEELKQKKLEEKERVEAQLRMADEEAKRKQEEAEKERLERIQRQRRSERRTLDRFEAVAKSKVQKPYCCTLMELGIITRCDSSWSCGCWGGNQHPLPLEQLGFINKQGENGLQEGEIMDELEEGEIR